MAIGIVRSAKSDGSYEKDYQCHTLCKFDDPEYISTRDTNILSLFSFGGTLSGRNYEVINRTAPTTVFNITAAGAAADTTIQFGSEAADYLESGQLMILGTEQVTVVSVDATGLATVIRGANPADFAVDDSAFITGKPTDFCESANCYVNEGECSIVNSIYRSNYCVSACKEELCELLDATPKCDRAAVLAEKVEQMIAEKGLIATRELNRMSLWGLHKEWTATQVGTSRGLRSTIVDGITADNGKVLQAVKYDAADSAFNSCEAEANGRDINGANGVRLLQEYFDLVDQKEGKHDVIIMNTKVKHALRDAIYQCTDSCNVGAKGDAVAFASLDVIDAGPLGTLRVVEDNSVPMNEIYFAHSTNLKWFGHCSANGNLQELKTVVDIEGFIEKYETTMKIAFDASQNMCSDLGIISGFQIGAAC